MRRKEPPDTLERHMPGNTFIQPHLYGNKHRAICLKQVKIQLSGSEMGRARRVERPVSLEVYKGMYG